MAEKVRDKFSAELKGRIISLMADIATLAQYSEDGKIVMRTLSMCEVHKHHTAETIADTIQETLNYYNVSINQIHSFTSDNAMAMLKSGRLLNDAANEIQNAICNEGDSDVEILSDSDVEISSDSDVEIVSDCANGTKDIARHVADILKTKNPSMQIVVGIGCAAHSLQIAIKDVIKASNVRQLIRNCRVVVKILRRQNMLIELRKAGASIPTLDVKTRWNSTHLMICKHLYYFS